MTRTSNPVGRPGSASIDAFVTQARQVAAREAQVKGRLIFALDATMSRQPMWDAALATQARMFEAAARHGGLAVQLLYYRGFSECRASSFVTAGEGLGRLMAGIAVQGGQTQIAKVLRHARAEAAGMRVGVLVFVGDAMEENPDDLAVLAGELALAGVKGFFFQEGHDRLAEATFRDLARITGGAYERFDSGAPERLAALLVAAASYAAGGFDALQLEARGNAKARLLLGQMGKAR